jgi:hypothetical protein
VADRPATRMPRPARRLCLAGLCPENHGEAALARVTVMPRPTACTASSVAVTSPSELQIFETVRSPSPIHGSLGSADFWG